MPKRKHSEIEDRIDKIEDRAIRIKASRLQAKINHGNSTLRDALVLAKGFERQKLGRRQKQASNEPHVLLRLREEVIVLKGLDAAKTARLYLFKQLAKTKRIKESNAFVAIYGRTPEIEKSKGSAEANVLGRLFKANPVKEVLPEIMSGIRQVLKLDEIKDADKLVDSSNTHTESHDTAPNVKVIPPDLQQGFDNSSDNEINEERTAEVTSLADESDDDSGEVYTGNLATSSNSDSESNMKNDELDPMEISDAESEILEKQNLSSSPLGVVIDSVMDTAHVKETKIQRPKTSTTAHLPSFTVGGYYSGSETDEEEYASRSKGPPLPKERKNRRGQRERQRLAELKHGKNANHLAKQPKEKQSRNSGWDAKRGAVNETKSHSWRGGAMGRQDRSMRERPGQYVKAPIAKAAVNDKHSKNKNSNEPLHPSWEAAKRRKQDAGIASFAGKKITFD